MQYFTHEIQINGITAPLHAYIPIATEKAYYGKGRPAVIVLPGGAYLFTAEHEGEPVALQYVAAGMCAFVLNYSVYPARFPQSLAEALTAVRYVREHAIEFSVDPNAIAICGFSAGGHLAACTGTLWNHACLNGILSDERMCYRPNALILGYPVLGDAWHHNSMLNLFEGKEEELTPERVELLTLENHVDAQTPPAFLWHNFGDTGVPCEGSLRFAAAMHRCAVPVELHLYSEGKHGCGLGTYVTGNRSYRDGETCQSWMPLSIDFIYRVLK